MREVVISITAPKTLNAVSTAPSLSFIKRQALVIILTARCAFCWRSFSSANRSRRDIRSLGSPFNSAVQPSCDAFRFATRIKVGTNRYLLSITRIKPKTMLATSAKIIAVPFGNTAVLLNRLNAVIAACRRDVSLTKQNYIAVLIKRKIIRIVFFKLSKAVLSGFGILSIKPFGLILV